MHPNLKPSAEAEPALALRRIMKATITLLLCAGFLTACGSADKKTDAKHAGAKATAANIKFAAGDVKVVRTGNTGEANLSDVDALLAATARYVQQASVNPLRGDPLRIADLLTAAARPNAVGSARDALTDAQFSPATESVKVTSAALPITILTDNTGAGALATVTIDLTISTQTRKGAVKIHRVGELAFVREGITWLIDGWRLTVNRDGKGTASSPKTSSSTKAP